MNPSFASRPIDGLLRPALHTWCLLTSMVMCLGRPALAASDPARIGALLDPQCEAMVAEPPELSTLLTEHGTRYFDAAIPRHLWLIDLCHPPEAVAAWRAAWHAYGARMHYEVHDVGPDDAPRQAPGGASGQNPNGLTAETRACWVAHKTTGWRALRDHGGIWVSPSLAPPVDSGDMIDFARLTPLRGLCVVASARPQHLRQARSGLTVSDTLVMAAPHHPVIEALYEQLPSNLAALERQGPNVHEAYLAGHVLLSRVMTGALTVLPRAFLARFEMCRGAKDSDCGA